MSNNTDVTITKAHADVIAALVDGTLGSMEGAEAAELQEMINILFALGDHETAAEWTKMLTEEGALA